MKMISEDDESRKVDAETVLAIASVATAPYRVKRAPGDWDDLDQDGALTAIEGVRMRGMPLSARGWHVIAARREAGLRMSRMLAVVSLSEHVAATRAREFQARIPIAARAPGIRRPPGAVDPAGGDRPDAALEAAAARRARAALVSHLGGHVARMEPVDRRILGMMLGLRGAEPMTSDEVAWATGETHQAVAAAVARLAARVRGDRVARRLRRQLRVTEEP